MFEIKCNELWGGIQGADLFASTNGIESNLFSSAANGGKGGDIYYFSVCGSDLLTRIALADVVGHGASVSNVSQWLYDALKERMNDVAGNQVLSDMNECAVTYGHEALTTATVAAYHRELKSFCYTYAGHHPILVKRDHQKHWESLGLEETGKQPSNLPLGVDLEYGFAQAEIELEEGDILFAYTDGVVEAPNARGEQFGYTGLIQALDEAGEDVRSIKHVVLSHLLEHTAGKLTHDDVTFMAFTPR